MGRRYPKITKFMLPPKLQNRYVRIRSLKKLGLSSSAKGIYKDTQTDRLVFVKANRDIDALKKEYFCQWLFYGYTSSRNSSHIGIPKPIAFDIINDYGILVMEYISGKTVINASTNVRLKAYIEILIYLRQLSLTRLPSTTHRYLPKNRKFSQLFSIPYFLALSLRHHPQHASILFKAAVRLMRYAVGWPLLSYTHVAHGDINVANLIVQKKPFLLDFAETRITHQFHDLACALNSTWFDPHFQDALWKEILSRWSLNKQDQAILKSFALLNLLQRLSTRYPKSDQSEFYIHRVNKLLSV